MKKKNVISLRFKLVIAFIVLSLISVGLATALSVTKATSVITNKVGGLTTATNDQFALAIDNYFKDFEEKVAMVFSDETIYSFNPNDNSLSEFDTINLKDEIKSKLAEIGIMISYNDFSIVYSDDSSIGSVSVTTSQLVGEDSLYEVARSFITREDSKDGWKLGYADDYNKIYYAKQINDNAILLISIYSTELNSILQYSNELEGMEVNILEDDVVLFSTDKNSVGKKISKDMASNIKDKEHYTYVDDESVIATTECTNDWSVVSTIPKNTILNEINQMVLFNIIVAAVCIAIAAVAGVMISMSVTGPIKKMLKSLEKAADGDFTSKVENNNRRDEVGQLIEHYHQMLDKMSSLIVNVNSVLDLVEISSDKVNTVANSNQDVSNNVSIAIEGIAGGISQQLDYSKVSFSQLEELAGSINDTIGYVDEISVGMDRAISISNDSIGKVDELSSTAQTSATAIDNASASVESLIDEMKNIQSVAQSILEISSETSLLALNASIEAARAGAAGRGFAVVAGEIGQLAEQTEKATQQIDKIVAGIYSKMDSTVQAMHETTKVMDSQTVLVEGVNTAFSEIVNSTQAVKKSVNQIANKAKNMGELKDVSLESIDNILDISESSSANAEEVMAITVEEVNNTQELFKYSKELKDNVDSLKSALAQFTVSKEELQ